MSGSGRSGPARPSPSSHPRFPGPPAATIQGERGRRAPELRRSFQPRNFSVAESIGGALRECRFAWKAGARACLAQRPEARANFFREQLWLLPGREVSALLDLVVVDEKQ
jgi:hypothetical protein